MATHSSTLAWKIPWATINGVAKNQTRLSDFTFTFTILRDVTCHSPFLQEILTFISFRRTLSIRR